MNDIVHVFHAAITYGCLAAGACLAAVVLYCLFGRALVTARCALSGRHLAAFVLLAGVACWAAQKRLVSFPRTDPSTAYLVDRGSYVDGDLVHIDFTRIIVPDTANMYVDRRERGGAEWENVLSSNFGDVDIPFEFESSNATNYLWIVYTDWTPGPSVQTNGVWHAMWGMDRRSRAHAIPLRTAVLVDGETIATPKSKEDAKDE